MGQNNIIELNGKQYDALTGALLGESKITATPTTQTAHLKRQGRAVDGFLRHNGPANNLKPVVVKPVSTPTRHAVVAKPTSHKDKTLANAARSINGVSRLTAQQRAAKALAHHQPEKPKTLMRHVVKKPKAEMKPAIKTTAPAEMMARPMSTLVKPLEKKLSVTQVNPVRMGRARHVPKSHHIRRFSENRNAAPVIAVSAPPITSTAVSSTSQPATTRPQQYATRPVRTDFRAAAPIPAVAAPAQYGEAKQHSTDIFEAALAHATSHEQKPLQTKRQINRRRRLANVMAGLGAFLIIAGFIAYLNKPTIELRVASMRAGFSAQMPSYKPTGYALEGGVKSSEGRVAMQFRSGESTYRITQEASDWNSSTLLDQAAESRGAPSRTIQSKGRTIYIYNDTSATWVNGGVRYEIVGDKSINAGDLVSLATSM